MITEIIQVFLNEEPTTLTVEKQRSFINRLSEIGEVSPEQIRILRQKERGGLWLALEMPTDVAKRLVHASQRVLAPIVPEFGACRIQQLHVEIPPSLQGVDEQNTFLIKLLYLGAARVVVEQELTGGYGGALILLVQIIDDQQNILARQILKLDTESELQREYENVTHRIAHDLPFIATRLIDHQVWSGLAGIAYSYVGGGSLGVSRTFEEYYLDNEIFTEQLTTTLRSLLDQELGQRWYGDGTPEVGHFAREYGTELVEQVAVEVRPESNDAIWTLEQEKPENSHYRPLTAKEISTGYMDLEADTLIYCDDLYIHKIKRNLLILHYEDEPGLVVKVRVFTEEGNSLSFSPGQRIRFRGQIRYNRERRMEELTQNAFANYGDFALNNLSSDQEKLDWPKQDCSYINPLYVYPKILDRSFRYRHSTVHGDLHLRNILIDQTGRGYLIDFALVQKRHNLYDFIKLETYIRQWILSQPENDFTFEEYLQFEELLTQTTFGLESAKPVHPSLRRAYKVIAEIRNIASKYIGLHVNFSDEYLPGLFLYNLAMLKFEAHGVRAAQLAFGTAVILGQHIMEKEQIQPRDTLSQEDNTRSDREATVDKAPTSSNNVKVHDLYTNLEISMKILLDKVDMTHPEYLTLLNYSNQLNYNISKARLFRDPERVRSERDEIIFFLNRVSLSILGMPFTDLAGDQ